MLAHGFSAKHTNCYCADQVTAEPEHLDDGLVRMRYSFPDASVLHLNLCPIRRNHIRRLRQEAAFERVRTHGEFQKTYQDADPGFFIHLAEKTSLHAIR